MKIKYLSSYFIIFFFISFSKNKPLDTHYQMNYTEQDILKNLDAVTGTKMFPNFGLSYFYPLNCRINLFADKDRWAIVFEVLTYNTKGYNIVIDNYCFSNCFIKKEKFNLTNIGYVLLSQVDSQNLLNDDWTINLQSKHIKIRDKVIDIEHNFEKYQEKKIRGLNFQVPEKGKLDIVLLTRYVAETNPDLMKATLKELKYNLPQDLPFIGSINEWHHENYSFFPYDNIYIGKSPSSYETFQLIAKCLVYKNMNFYKPSLNPNNNWRNWPDAGGL